MRNPRELSPSDIADDLVKLHNLPKNDRTTHDALLQEVNAYFQYNINDLKQKAAQGQIRDLRTDVVCLFQNVINMTSFDQREGQKSPFHMAIFDEAFKDVPSKDGKSTVRKSFLELDAYEPDRNKIPLCFQIADSAPRDNTAVLSFTIKTHGEQNADYLYQEFQRRNMPFPPQFKTWSQYWGSGSASQTQPYKPADQQPIRRKNPWMS